ncbi:MAG TPA: PKD domain-containing protein [Methylococcaceae bacterium]|nr:PKD domain-containing protein [Methylococcaceae bacterium]
MKRQPTFRRAAFGAHRTFLAATIGSLLWAGYAAAETQTYTLNGDFDDGTLDGVNYTDVADQLQLNETGTTFPLMWIANGGGDTVSKIDTNLNKETGRYRTWFFGNHESNPWVGPAPSRTAVDLDGNVYVANRHFDNKPASVMKILANGYIDRNGNGVMDTSTDSNNNGTIDPAEIKPLVDSNGNGIVDPAEIQDERVAWVKQVGPVNGLGRSLCIDREGDIWLGLFNTLQYYELNASDGSTKSGPYPTPGLQPYGCLVDGNGVLWSAGLSPILGKLNNTTITSPSPVWTTHVSPHGNFYGIALGNGKVYLSSYGQGRSFTQFDPTTSAFSDPLGVGINSLGIGVDGNGKIVTGSQRIYKQEPTGATIWTSAVNPASNSGNYVNSRGVIPDSNNDIWVVNVQNNSVTKFNGVTGALIAQVPVGSNPYTYSDATGFAVRNVTSPSGFWTVVKDSGEAGSEWDSVAWNATTPTGTEVKIEVRASDNQANLSSLAWETVSNGGNPGAVGRYAEIHATLKANTNGDSPVLSDLTVGYSLADVPPVADAGGGENGYSVPEGSSVQLLASCTDPDGDLPSSYAWDLDNDGQYDDATGAAPSFSAAGLDGPSSQTVAVECTANGKTATDTATIAITNVAPSLGPIADLPVAPIPVNTAVNPSVAYTDPGVPDTHTGQWSWDDGSANSAGSASGGTMTGSHTYTAPGIYTVGCTLADDDGASATCVDYQYVVVYDPNGGFVTGGGTIDSPEGAYTADPSLVGTANFGFISKYQKGATVPTGNTEFQFRTAGLNFHSTSYQWLVVSGARAQYKGEGTVNGEGGYGFLLSAIDGQVTGGGGMDKFRIKIWNAGGVVYDNQMGAADDAEATTAIHSGSIVVHTKGK